MKRFELTKYFKNINSDNGRLFYDELKSIKIDNRNKIRALVSMNVKERVLAMEKLREINDANELSRIENVIRTIEYSSTSLIPELFPKDPQTKENYNRLEELSLKKQLAILEIHIRHNFSKLTSFFQQLKVLNTQIIQKEFMSADESIHQIYESVGYSHILLRKAALLQSLSGSEDNLNYTSAFLKNSGIGTNNLIVNSVMQCYQTKQDYLILKRSLLNLNDKGKSNQFTRDMTRYAFHPFSTDSEDLKSLLHSSFQSSLIDAIVFLKQNIFYIEECNHALKSLEKCFEILEECSFDIDTVSGFYNTLDDMDIDNESLFFKHSSAWFENNSFIGYRLLLDFYYEDPDSKLSKINNDINRQLESWIKINKMSDVLNDDITNHSYQNLKILERNGLITRTAVFNRLSYEKEGFFYIDEESLYKLMSVTKDLDKTINIEMLKNAAKITDSLESKIIYYLLIAKKSKNESDSFYLRRIVQNITLSNYQGNIVDFLEHISKQSQEVAEYMYEVFTEDFLARLPHIITKTPHITETRAALHKWMGEKTGRKAFLDRARTLLIDHQINRVRNEIDDNRIYVDSARFIEWAKDEVAQDISTVLTNITHVDITDYADDPQLLHIIEKSYFAFCNNNIFGISSYLGRRIRHGTFKGHLYNNVINIERKYPNLLRDQYISFKWNQWKVNYESCIDKIIKDNLHVESNSKREGLLKPNLKNINKHDIVYACAYFIAKDYIESKNTNNSILIILEYCWRMAEVDLKNVNHFLKSKKNDLHNSTLLDEIKNHSHGRVNETTRDFVRDLQTTINEKLTSMYGWFKRPLSVSPKASLPLLYQAVVAEVKESFVTFDADTSFTEDDDIELVGGPYHVLYDAFYVVIYNAAKHGKDTGNLSRTFAIHERKVLVTISSEIKDCDNEKDVNERLMITADSDIANAQSSEERSGIRKLYHLQSTDDNFKIEEITCVNRKVTISISYSLEH
ncbi:hypothetical protein [Enterobacter sp.]|uniref:hypothetical protein n=1 Tax=Enterobacter sp. TaxID=42895 RepID=UPI00296E9D53|nr:hypothetical protein [Enterobacter sp.]